MNEKEVIELEQRLRKQFETDLAAVHRVRELLGERTQLSGAISANSSAADTHRQPVSPVIQSNGTVESKVLTVIREFDRKFTLADVVDKLEQRFSTDTFNRNTISGIVFRNKGKAFRVVTPGRGRKLAYYEKMI